jgi:dihydrofolate synthase/folylpolyglutamate synthase
MSYTSAASVEAYLQEIPTFQSVGSSAASFDLSRFKQFCDDISNPHHQFPAIHVAGTNGKGSTCQLLGSIYQQAGYQAGVYTSPHIVRFNERFQIGNKLITDDELLSFFDAHADKFEQYNLTYFEISTAIAFWWFAQKQVDIAIIEVGLGGRLDATNIIEPLLSVITSISLDHTDLLGDSLAEIAREKGGIVKHHTPVVIGDLPDEARNEIQQIAQQQGSAVHTIDELNPQYRGSGKFVIDRGHTQIHLSTKLMAPVQAKNIAIAWQVVQQLQQFPVSTEVFVEAVGRAALGAGRFERLLSSQQWYFDGGHNLEAVRALKQSVASVGPLDKATLLLSILRDKIRPEVMEEFSGFGNIYYYQLNLERAASFDDISKWLPQAKPFPDDRRQQLLLNDFNSELVIFAGSFYFYATVRDWVKNLKNR